MRDYRLDEYDLVDNHVNYAANRIENIQSSLFNAIPLIVNCSENNGIDGLSYIDIDKVREYNETLGHIKYLYDLFKCIVNDYRENVDNPFYKDIEPLLKDLSDVKTEDIEIDNNLGIKGQSTANKEGEIREYEKTKISFEDLLNYGDVSKIMQQQYKSIKDVDCSFEQYIEQLVKSGEVQYATQLQKFISIGLDLIPIIGDIKGLVEAVIGKDLITNQDLSDLERGLSALSAIPGFGDAMDIAKGGAKVFLRQLLTNVALFGASSVGSVACEQLGIGRKGYLAILLLATAGVKNREEIINALKSGDFKKTLDGIDNVDDVLKSNMRGRIEFNDFIKLSAEEQKSIFNSMSSEEIYNLIKGSSAKWIIEDYDLITMENAKDFVKLIINDNGETCLNLTWPKYGGYDPNTIASISELSGKIPVSRDGGDYGYTMGIGKNEDGSYANNSQRSIPKSSAQVNTGVFDVDLYKSSVDIVTSNDSDFSKIERLNALGFDDEIATNMISDYNSWKTRLEIVGEDNISEGVSLVGKSVDGKYGYYGNAAEWNIGNVSMCGGAGQMNTIYSWGTLKNSGIITNIGKTTIN